LPVKKTVEFFKPIFKKVMSKVEISRNRIIAAFGAILKNLDDNKGFTPEDFANLRTNEGPLFEPNVQTISEIIELGNMMKVMGVENTYNYLVENVIPKKNEIYEADKTEYFSILIFDSPLLDDQKKVEEAMLRLNDDKGPLTDSVSCKNCGNPKVHRKVKQTR